MSKAAKAAKQEARRKSAVALAQTLSTPEATPKQAVKAAAPAAQETRPAATGGHKRSHEWFHGLEGKAAHGPFESQEQAFEDLRQREPKHAKRLVRRFARFVRVGVWKNLVKQGKDKTYFYTVTREGNQNLLKLPASK